MRRIIILAAVLAALAWGARADDPVVPPRPDHSPKTITEYGLTNLDRKISLDLIDPMEIGDLIKFLAVKGDLNVIVGRDVTGTTKLMLKDVPLGDVIEIVLAANNLAYEVRGTIIKVMTDKEYQSLYGVSFYERKQAKIIQLKYASAKDMAAILEPIKSSVGKIVSDPATGTLVLIDTPEKIREMEAVVRQAEIPTVLRENPTVTTNFVLQYARVEDVEPQITPLLNKEMGQVHSDKRTKTLVVTDLPNNIRRIAAMVAAFDKEQRQVFIEAKIVQVVLSDEFKMGVNWDHVFQGLDPRFAVSAAAQFPLALQAADPAGTLNYRTIASGSDLNIVVQALQTVGDAKVLSDPHIAVLDGQEATIKVISQQPYAELGYDTGSTNVTTKTYKFIDVGVTLGVTPRINDEGFITVSIKPEVSTILGFYDTAGGQGVPIVKKSTAETSVVVKDGVTIIIGGLIDETTSKNTTGLPLLSRIPFLGALFRTTDTLTQNAELIVLLTPRIVTGTKFFERSRDIKKQPHLAAPNSTPATAPTPAVTPMPESL